MQHLCYTFTIQHITQPSIKTIIHSVHGMHTNLHDGTHKGLQIIARPFRCEARCEASISLSQCMVGYFRAGYCTDISWPVSNRLVSHSCYYPMK